MGKLAQKFNLSQGKRKDVEQAETSDASAKGRLPTSQSYPVQLQGSQVLRRNDGFDFPMAFHSMASEPLADPRSYHARSLGASPGLMATESRAYKVGHIFALLQYWNKGFVVAESTLALTRCPWKSTVPRSLPQSNERF